MWRRSAIPSGPHSWKRRRDHSMDRRVTPRVWTASCFVRPTPRIPWTSFFLQHQPLSVLDRAALLPVHLYRLSRQFRYGILRQLKYGITLVDLLAFGSIRGDWLQAIEHGGVGPAQQPPLGLSSLPRSSYFCLDRGERKDILGAPLGGKRRIAGVPGFSWSKQTCYHTLSKPILVINAFESSCRAHR